MNVWIAETWHAWRASLRRPGFLLLASGVLALGIGASVAVFALIDQVLLQPLPLPNTSRVVVVGSIQDGQVSSVSTQQYQHLQSLSGVASMGLAFSGSAVNVSADSHPEVVPATYVDRGLLPTLGLQPVLGSNFTAQEDAPHGSHVAMLGYGFWLRRYGGDTKVLGQTLQIKGDSYTIVGVLPKGFGDLNIGADVVLPLGLPANSTDDGTNYVAVARLARGASRQAVAAEVNARMQSMYRAMTDYPFAKSWLRTRFGVQQLAVWQNADAHAALALFMACALFVLLTALVNLVNLMLLRSLSRAHDGAVRGALGAPPLRLALPALAEGGLVGIMGALAGTGLAVSGLASLQSAFSTQDWWPSGSVRVSPAIGLLALGMAVVVGVLAACLGVWRSRATASFDELREGGRSGMGRQSGRLGRVLVVAQMVLATVLLCATGLLLHGMYKAESTPLGFSSANMLTFDLAPLEADYPDAPAVDALSLRLVRRLEAIPGVTAATATTNLPAGEQFNLSVHRPGALPLNDSPQYRAVGPGFLSLFGIPVLKGRAFDRDDMRGGESVAIVNRALAAKMFGGHALGQLIQGGDGAHAWSARIVGVVGDTRQFGPLQPAPPVLYVPLAQVPNRDLAIFRSFEPMRFVLHGRGNPDDWRSAVHAAMTEVAPNQPIGHFRTMREVVHATTSGTRTTLLLVGIFAALALLLAVAGMYAVMAVAVAAREREFGVRMALGADPTRLLWLVLRGGVAQIAVGLVIGVVVVLAISGQLTQWLATLVARTNTFDPVAIVGVCIVLGVAGLLACLLPALRAARVAPMRALKGE